MYDKVVPILDMTSSVGIYFETGAKTFHLDFSVPSSNRKRFRNISYIVKWDTSSLHGIVDNLYFEVLYGT